MNAPWSTIPDLVDQLRSPEQWTRHQARNVLAERDPDAVAQALAVIGDILDVADGIERRASVQEEQYAYLDAHAQSIMVRGPLLTDDGASQIGSVMLFDSPDMAANRALLDNMPFTKAGVYKDITFHRWRFGRVFDRYKV